MAKKTNYNVYYKVPRFAGRKLVDIEADSIRSALDKFEAEYPHAIVLSICGGK